MKKALILEDHVETLTRLKEILASVFPQIKISVAETIAEAKKLSGENEFSLALIDINLPDGSGIDFIAQENQAQSQCYFVVTTMFDEDDYIFRALTSGAQGYVLKDQSDEEITHLLRGIINGCPPLSPSISRTILKHFSIEKTVLPESNLSQRESEVLTFIAKGYTRKEVSKLMEISITTVSEYIKSVYRKLSINNCSEATLEAVRLGLISIESLGKS